MIKVNALSRNIGEYKHFNKCRFCAYKTIPVINLGHTPLAGGFLKNKKQFLTEKLYPLTLSFCNNCYLLQCNDIVSPEILFKDYFYTSSSMITLLDHFEEIASEAKNNLKDPTRRFIVEIGCNDGGFIKALMSKNIKAIGVDPATNIVKPLIKKGYPIINDYFGKNLAKKITKKYGKANAIYSFHSMAHIEDMHDVLRGIKVLLKKDGYLALEVHYLGSLLKDFQYDMIYHEHEYYYSLLSLKNFFSQYDMEIFDVKFYPVRAGSMMYYIQNKKGGKNRISRSVTALITQERKQKLDKVETYLKFSSRINNTKNDLVTHLTKLKKKNKIIIGYGASGRGAIIMNYCNLSLDLLDYVVDDSKAKWNAFMPGTHQKIRNPKMLYKKFTPDYAVLFAWPFLEEISKRNAKYLKNNGKFIVPLPRVRMIGYEYIKNE